MGKYRVYRDKKTYRWLRVQKRYLGFIYIDVPEELWTNVGLDIKWINVSNG